MAGRSSVKVVVRIRPFIAEETARDESSLILSSDNEQTVGISFHDVKDSTKDKVTHFGFDRVYWSHNKDHPLYATQETVYQELGKDMIQHALSGFNTCIFAYGQTGSGKSYSVLGDKSHDGRGLLPRIVEGLFDKFESQNDNISWSCFVSAMEIYNEQLRDLLVDTKGGAERPLKIQNHPVLGVIVYGLTDISVRSKEQVWKAIDQGGHRRAVGATSMNAQSSRSHCVFSFKTAVTDSQGLQLFSQTHLVDLAGSERVSKTKAQGQRLTEGNSINKSLATLTRVIMTLAENCSASKSVAKVQVPFRDSKLTHILKESLSGNSKTVMMAALSPSAANYDETMSTLRFASSAKSVKITASANKVKVESEQAVEMELREEISAMKKRLMQERFIRLVKFSQTPSTDQQQSSELKVSSSEANSKSPRPPKNAVDPEKVGLQKEVATLMKLLTFAKREYDDVTAELCELRATNETLNDNSQVLEASLGDFVAEIRLLREQLQESQRIEASQFRELQHARAQGYRDRE